MTSEIHNKILGKRKYFSTELLDFTEIEEIYTEQLSL